MYVHIERDRQRERDIYVSLSLFIYIYIYIYREIYKYMYLSLYIYIYIYKEREIHIYVSLSLYIYIYICIAGGSQGQGIKENLGTDGGTDACLHFPIVIWVHFKCHFYRMRTFSINLEQILGHVLPETYGFRRYLCMFSG